MEDERILKELANRKIGSCLKYLVMLTKNKQMIMKKNVELELNMQMNYF